MKNTLSLLIAAICLSASAYANEPTKPFSEQQETRIQDLIRETLIKNPEILEDAANALQVKQVAEQAKAQKKQISTYREQLFNDAASPRLGAKNAKVTLVYFTDYNCPYCKRFDPEMIKLTEKYPDLAIVVKVVPFLGESSKEAAELATSIWLQKPESFSQIHHDMMAKKSRHDDSTLKAILAQDGFKDFAVSDKGKEAVQRNFELSQRLGIRGTPATIIGDEIISGAVPIENIEALIKRSLQ